MLLRVAQNLRDYSGESLDIEVNPSYSGRGSFGKTTAAIVCDSRNDFYQAIADCSYCLGLRQETKEYAELFGELASIREDLLGNQHIFY
jgi:hypothetical protein